MICLCKLNHVINHTQMTSEVYFWLQYSSTTIQLYILGNPISQCPSQMYVYGNILLPFVEQYRTAKNEKASKGVVDISANTILGRKSP